MVTTDDGRSQRFASHAGEHPESARVWLVAAGAGVATRGRASSPEMRHLANVAPTVRALLGIAQTADTEAPLGELLDTVSVRDGEMAAR